MPSLVWPVGLYPSRASCHEADKANVDLYALAALADLIRHADCTSFSKSDASSPTDAALDSEPTIRRSANAAQNDDDLQQQHQALLRFADWVDFMHDDRLQLGHRILRTQIALLAMLCLKKPDPGFGLLVCALRNVQ